MAQAKDPNGTFVKEAIYVGAVGPRLAEQPEHMECQEIVITPEKNVPGKQRH